MNLPIRYLLLPNGRWKPVPTPAAGDDERNLIKLVSQSLPYFDVSPSRQVVTRVAFSIQFSAYLLNHRLCFRIIDTRSLGRCCDDIQTPNFLALHALLTFAAEQNM
ncbi:hypothetical protein QVD17_15257 [Tagetes erecta]|uniref:Uncharacterized protein n=1 Tax=Tagetes erecta TaxID=13708 RepID=A0AAD8KSV8_TARER|nr:hypothetical protein QVD17_15257 [Tagetes erecta]